MSGPERPTFRTILVGDDRARGGQDAAALARQFAEHGTTIIATHHERGDSAARSVAKHLHELADQHHADLIVVGAPSARSHADQPLADLPAIVHHSPCSVAVAPRGYAQSLTKIGSIGVGFREVEPAQLATAIAIRLGERLQATVHALGVLQQTPSPWRGPALGTLDAVQSITGNAEHELRDQLARLPGVTAEVAVGEPVEQLRKFAERHQLLVIGAPGRGAMRRLVVGSVAEGIMSSCSCPLLIAGGERVPAAV